MVTIDKPSLEDFKDSSDYMVALQEWEKGLIKANEEPEMQKVFDWWESMSYDENTLLRKNLGINPPVKGKDILRAYKITFPTSINAKPVSVTNTDRELKATPGEWKVSPYQFGLVGTRFDDSVKTTFIAQIFSSGEEAEANAHLIAASKDMYNALENLYKDVLLCRDNKKSLSEAVEALKKANPSYSQSDHLTK